jgi:glycosyltransferase involved in cell wall biosynthesis
MRILFVQNRYRDGAPGGTEQMCRQLGEGLRVRGHEVAMLTSRQSAPSAVFNKLWPRLSMLMSDWLYRGGPAAGAVWLANHAWNWLATWTAINSFKPDVVYIHNSENILAGPLNAAVDCKTRVVVHVHNHLYDQWAGSAAKLSRLGRMIKPKLDGATFIAVSQHMASELAASGIPSDRINTIHNGLPDGIFEMPAEKRREGSLVFAGSRATQKGYHVLLEAVAMMKKHDPGITVDVYGAQIESPYAVQCEKYIRDNDLVGNIRIKGPVGRERLWEAFGESDVLLAPSIWSEPFGLVIAEAMCRGMIVVASNRGGLPEVVGGCGFVVEPTPQSVADACEKALRMPKPEKEAMRRAARRRVKKLFRFSDQLKAYEEVLGGAVDLKRA